jgi:hypothetical protein
VRLCPSAFFINGLVSQLYFNCYHFIIGILENKLICGQLHGNPLVFPIEIIAYDWQSVMGEVIPDLMRPSRQNFQL